MPLISSFVLAYRHTNDTVDAPPLIQVLRIQLGNHRLHDAQAMLPQKPNEHSAARNKPA